MTPEFSDERLGRMLRAACTVEPRRSHDFKTRVWAKIDSSRGDPFTWSAWARVRCFRLASIAVATVVLGSAGGGWLAAKQAERNRERLVQRYLASIDPHQHASFDSR